MARINLLGSSSLCGQAFLDKCETNHEIFKYSRNDKNSNYLDINNIFSLKKLNLDLFKDSYIISFSPIWVTSKFINFIADTNKKVLFSLKGIIICSSSSVLTKKYAINRKDKDLAYLLASEEKKISVLCKSFKVSCIIVRPTMIYGRVSDSVDSNIFKIFKLTKIFPFIILPNKSGYRQPIHAIQLAKVILFLFEKLRNHEKDVFNIEILGVGGDEIISYEELIKRISAKHNFFGIFKKTRVISIPKSLFYFIMSPIILFDLRLFEALYRMGADLSGFESASKITGKKPVKFPYLKY